ncbi:MAG: PEP-CTERM/exosortase system-associated acyltransferase [Elusimicrobia bacterium]|nr:PEP-CTERM/exosortase system-associated acyltransferase [Elusimicrobiota bacterium]
MFRLGEFTFLEATEPNLIDAIHRLRYQIYVEEYGYEKPADHPGGVERDKFDPYSVPIAALDRQGKLVGTARLIHHCPHPLPALLLASPPWREEHGNDPHLVESSRFAMSREFRLSALGFKREMSFFRKHLIPGTQPRPPADEVMGPDDPSGRILIFLGLSYAVIDSAHRQGATHHLMTAERSLHVLLKRNGIHFDPIGPEVDYHGRRTPYAGVNEEMFKSVQSIRSKVFTFLSQRSGKVSPASQERALAEKESFRLGGFRFGVASEDERLDQVFQLRHRSYAEDFALIPSDSFPDKRERDVYDPWSLHAVAMDSGDRLVGTARLVLNTSLGIQSLESADPQERLRLSSTKKVAELSRLALAKPYGQAFADVLSVVLSIPLGPCSAGSMGPSDRRRAAVITLGLFRLLYRISKTIRLSGWCLLADDKMIDLLSRHQIHPELLGPENKTLGNRRPILLRFSDLETHLTNFSKIRAFARDAAFRGAPMSGGPPPTPSEKWGLEERRPQEKPMNTVGGNIL